MAKNKIRVDESLSKESLEKAKTGTTNKEIDTSKLKVEDGNVLPKEEIKKEKIKEYKYPIDSFVEDSVNVRKRRGSGFAFKSFYKLTIKGSFHDKKTMKEWEILFNKFMNTPTK